LYAQQDQQAGASPTVSHPESATQPQPTAGREAGQ